MGHSQILFHLKNSHKDVIVNSDIDGRSQKCCSRESRVGISRKLNTNRACATFGQSELQVRCKRQIS